MGLSTRMMMAPLSPRRTVSSPSESGRLENVVHILLPKPPGYEVARSRQDPGNFDVRPVRTRVLTEAYTQPALAGRPTLPAAVT